LSIFLLNVNTILSSCLKLVEIYIVYLILNDLKTNVGL